MDLAGLGSSHEATYFLRKCEEISLSFEKLTHIGGVLNNNDDKDSWYWIWSNEKIRIDLKFKPDSDKAKESNCLQLIKDELNDFFYSRANCFTPELDNR